MRARVCGRAIDRSNHAATILDVLVAVVFAVAAAASALDLNAEDGQATRSRTRVHLALVERSNGKFRVCRKHVALHRSRAARAPLERQPSSKLINANFNALLQARARGRARTREYLAALYRAYLKPAYGPNLVPDVFLLDASRAIFVSFLLS